MLDQLTKERRSLSARIEERVAKKVRLADLLLEGAVDLPTHNSKRDELDFELVQLRQSLDELPDPKTIKAERTRALNQLSNLLTLYNCTDRTGQRQLLRETFSSRTANQSQVHLQLMSWATKHLSQAPLSTADRQRISNP